MKKILCKVLSITIFVMINIFVVFNSFAINANEQSDLYQEISRNDVVVMNDVSWTNIIANTKTTMPKGWDSGYGSSTPIDTNKWYGQQINVLNVPRVLDADGNQKYEIVSWSMQGDQQWEFKGMTALATDFEKNNPDYIVVGGVNGDFYDWHTTLDYPNSGNGIESQNGELIRAVRSGREAIGFKNNNDNDQIVYASNTFNAFSTNPFLTIYNEDGTILKEIELNGVNLSNLEEGQTSAYFPSLEIVYLYDENGNHILNSYSEWAIKERILHSPTLAEGNSYFVLDGEKVIYQAAEGSYYGKGKITNVNDNSIVGKNSFAIVTKNNELLDLLNENVSIRVQYKVVDSELAKADNLMGSGHILMKDGEFVDYYAEEYYSTRAPRTIVACKADGTVCLLTMDGRQPGENYYGTNQQEINEILTQLGIDDAYLMDGGGSSTFFVRENESFIIKNSPSDGGQRSVSNGFLIVTKKDDSVKIKSIESKTSSLTFTLDDEAMSDDITACHIVLNGEKKSFVNGEVTFENLNSNTSYEYHLSYDTEYYKNIATTTVLSAKTLKKVPTVTLGEITEDDKYFYPTCSVEDPDRAVQMIEIILTNAKTSKKVSSVLVDPTDDSLTIKLKKNANVNEYDCTLYFYYRCGNSEELVILEFEYDMSVFNETPEEPEQPEVPEEPEQPEVPEEPEQPEVPEEPEQPEDPEKPKDDNNKGCNLGIVFITPLVAGAALLLVIFKKR